MGGTGVAVTCACFRLEVHASRVGVIKKHSVSLADNIMGGNFSGKHFQFIGYKSPASWLFSVVLF